MASSTPTGSWGSRMKFSNAALDQIRALRTERDRAAARLGAAWLDFVRLQETSSRGIDESLRVEREMAERELRALGLDPDAETYSIADDGTVLIVRAGLRVPVEG